MLLDLLDFLMSKKLFQNICLFLAKMETRVSIPAAYTKPSGLVAQFCNPATGGQGYLDGAGHLGLNTWLGLDLLFHC